MTKNEEFLFKRLDITEEALCIVADKLARHLDLDKEEILENALQIAREKVEKLYSREY